MLSRVFDRLVGPEADRAERSRARTAGRRSRRRVFSPIVSTQARPISSSSSRPVSRPTIMRQLAAGWWRGRAPRRRAGSRRRATGSPGPSRSARARPIRLAGPAEAGRRRRPSAIRDQPGRHADHDRRQDHPRQRLARLRPPPSRARTIRSPRSAHPDQPPDPARTGCGQPRGSPRARSSATPSGRAPRTQGSMPGTCVTMVMLVAPRVEGRPDRPEVEMVAE